LIGFLLAFRVRFSVGVLGDFGFVFGLGAGFDG